MRGKEGGAHPSVNISDMFSKPKQDRRVNKSDVFEPYRFFA